MTCPYITSLDKPCGRPATHDDHCGLHLGLSAIDALDSADELFELLDLLEGMKK